MNRYKNHFRCPGCGLSIRGHSDSLYHLANGPECKESKVRMAQVTEVMHEVLREISEGHVKGQEEWEVKVGTTWNLKDNLKKLKYPWPKRVRVQQIKSDGMILVGYGKDYFKKLEVRDRQEMIEHYKPSKDK